MATCPLCGRHYDSDLAYCAACRDAAEGPTAARQAGADGPDELRPEIVRLCAAGQKIAAIKLYRDRTGADLAEAKRVVEAIEFPRPPGGGDLDGRLVALLKQNQKIEAIRVYRKATGTGLKEAKEAVETLARQHGILVKGAGCAGMALIACTLGAALAAAIW